MKAPNPSSRSARGAVGKRVLAKKPNRVSAQCAIWACVQCHTVRSACSVFWCCCLFQQMSGGCEISKGPSTCCPQAHRPPSFRFFARRLCSQLTCPRPAEELTAPILDAVLTCGYSSLFIPARHPPLPGSARCQYLLNAHAVSTGPPRAPCFFFTESDVHLPQLQTKAVTYFICLIGFLSDFLSRFSAFRNKGEFKNAIKDLKKKRQQNPQLPAKKHSLTHLRHFFFSCPPFCVPVHLAAHRKAIRATPR
jgi:hypothetical protein